MSNPLTAAWRPPVVLGDLCLRCGAFLDPGRDFDNHGPCKPTESTAEVAVRAATPARSDAEGLLGGLDEDDVMYDYPVAMSGEPMDPVLFVRWDAVRAALATQSRGLDVDLRGALDWIEQAAKAADHDSIEDGPAFARGARMAAARIASRLAATQDPETEG